MGKAGREDKAKDFWNIPQDTTKGTLFGAYNAVTGYFHNVKSYKDTETKFKSIMTGNALGRAQATFDLCIDFHGLALMRGIRRVIC